MEESGSSCEQVAGSRDRGQSAPAPYSPPAAAAVDHTSLIRSRLVKTAANAEVGLKFTIVADGAIVDSAPRPHCQTAAERLNCCRHQAG